jgi:hypothetical protein
MSVEPVPASVSAVEIAPRAPSLGSSRESFIAGIRKAARALADIVYPPACLVCQTAIAEPRALCARCWGHLRLIERPYCERLGTPFAVDTGQGLLSPAAIADPPGL